VQLQNYKVNNAGDQKNSNHLGRSWIQQPLSMQVNEDSNSGDESKPDYITVDDVITLAQELLSRLNQLGGYRYPLDVRRGRKEVVNMVGQKDKSKTLKAGSKTYFFDVKETQQGKPYLVLTESRFKGNGEDRERRTIIVFQENVQEFADAVSGMAKKMG